MWSYYRPQPPYKHNEEAFPSHSHYIIALKEEKTTYPLHNMNAIVGCPVKYPFQQVFNLV